MPSSRRAIALAVVVALIGRRAHAQCSTNPCTIPVTGTLNINAAARLSLSQTTTTLDAPRAADFAAGKRQTAGPTLTVQSNTNFHVVVSSTDPTWKRNGVASTKPVGDLSWATAAGGTYNALTTSAGSTTLNGNGSGPTSRATDGLPLSIFYQVAWSWTKDAPGTYTLPVVLTLISP